MSKRWHDLLNVLSTDRQVDLFLLFLLFSLFLPFDLPISFDFHCTVVWWIYRSLHLRQSHTAWTNSTKLFYTSIIILTHQIKSSKNEGVKLGIVFVFLLFKICTECMPKFATLLSPSHGSLRSIEKEEFKAFNFGSSPNQCSAVINLKIDILCWKNNNILLKSNKGHSLV